MPLVKCNTVWLVFMAPPTRCWLQKWGKCEATSEFDMIMIYLTTSLNYSKSFFLGSKNFTVFFFKKWNCLNSHSVTTFRQKYAQEIHPSIPLVNIFLHSHIQWIYSLNSLNTSTTKWKKFDFSHITRNMSCVKKSKSLTMEELHQKWYNEVHP